MGQMSTRPAAYAPAHNLRVLLVQIAQSQAVRRRNWSLVQLVSSKVTSAPILLKKSSAKPSKRLAQNIIPRGLGS
ncbi:hypothetical protein BQ8482_320007 [Mesorhizobium delmotii]|uniref:Uncharacterized protein n=1 Tax=Mesorhizobium delmotii TaxID=1631247 RepID=A0A2P9AP06_9HYPH|nr:hypothetical protein BQ8482_320007 [Mesorhizobium delmotii]